jgi:predicted AlkP superfamily pyrophosphatase or phosphodiesterase
MSSSRPGISKNTGWQTRKKIRVVTPKSDDVKGTHGYDPNQPGLHATFVAWGAGIRPHAKLGTMNNIDVAPTIAELLGLKFENADGRALESILVK